MRYLNYNFAENSKIFWENSNNFYVVPNKPIKEKYDLVIIGGGLTSLSTAYHLKDNKNILIVDKDKIGYGGSNRNGGFCCLGGTKLSFSDFEKKYGFEELKKFFSIQKDAINLVREVLDKNFSESEEGEITYYYDKKQLDDELKELENYQKKLNLNYEYYSVAELKQKNLYLHNSTGAIKMNYGFGVNPKNLVHALLKKILLRENIHFLEDQEVKSINEYQNHNEIVTKNYSIKSEKVILATNGYLNNKNLNIDIYKNLIPALSNILVTEPIPKEKFNLWKTKLLCTDNKKLLHYFRLLDDNRILFGGRGGLSYQDTNTYKKILIDDYHNMLPEFIGTKIEYFWRGLVGLTYDKIPHIGQKKNILHAYGYNGNGVSMSTLFGKILAKMIDKEINFSDLPKSISSTPKKLLFPDLKRFYLYLAYQYYNLRQ